MRRLATRRQRRATPVATVVAAPRMPRLGLGQRQLQAAGATGLLGLGTAVLAAAEIVAVVIVVVAQPEEPHKPHDKRPDVKDSEANHEDPPLQGHLAESLSQASGVCKVTP